MKLLIIFLFPLISFAKVGEVAPNFQLKAHHGKTYSLIDSTPSTNPDDIKESKNYVQLALDESLEGKEVRIKRSKAYGCGVKY